jgi:hypothetical protein
MNMTRKGNKLTLEIDLVPEGQAQVSKSGKSKIAYTTGGFKYHEGLGLSINAIYRDKKVA